MIMKSNSLMIPPPFAKEKLGMVT
ncbi:uncharacterized protein METZ01_LOCUS483507 [marine metagenome]|uniref:Uncharacterized protein n=1 Tax=marine metagenome TaxID=408172 RepID=A0A383CF09_9ZZZZ